MESHEIEESLKRLVANAAPSSLRAAVLQRLEEEAGGETCIEVERPKTALLDQFTFARLALALLLTLSLSFFSQQWQAQRLVHLLGPVTPQTESREIGESWQLVVDQDIFELLDQHVVDSNRGIAIHSMHGLVQ